RIMEEYDRMYPEYEFAKHKGYPTKRHLELLERYGVLPIYRKSYRPVAKLIEEKENPDLFHM
ncbi:MAG: ribonuclease HII, partial [Erysipelotrichaceae bacterium]|nr:ribonuclease HII [Erysipelotrichaceae bacterium]